MSLLLLPAVAVVVAGTAGSLRRAARERRRTAENLRDSVEALRALASELAAGMSPLEVVRTVAADLDALDEPDRRVRATLHRAGQAADGGISASHLARSGLPGLSAFGSAWRVSDEVGAGLAESASRLAAVASRSANDAREVSAVLAGPRTTAQLLAILPGIGLLMAATTGAHPLAFLLQSPGGRLCLFAGVSLDAAGLWWIERLAART